MALAGNQGDGKGNTVLQITNFTTGIVGAPNTYGVPIVQATPSAPSASMNTYGCIAMPTGGLAPLPAPQAQVLPDTGYSGAFYNGTSGYPAQFVGGVASIGGGQNRALMLALRTPYSVGYCASIWTNEGSGWTKVVDDHVNAVADNGWLSGMLPFSTNWAAHGSPYGAYAQDELLIASTWAPRVSPYPELSSSEVLAYDNNQGTGFEMAVGRSGFAAPNQLSTLFVYTTGSGVYNQFGYINPVLSAWSTTPNPDFQTAAETTGQIYQTNQPSAVGAMGTVTSGQLLVVTQDAGGYIISGVIGTGSTPYVTLAPGVQSTASLLGQACITPLGLAYCSLDNGMWLWSGGSQAQKISTQLPDDFFFPTGYPPTGQPPTNPQGFWYSCFFQGNWLYVSNGWIYDMVQSSWWQIKAPDDYPFMYYAANGSIDDLNVAGRSDIVYCFPGTYNSQNLNVGARMAKSRPATTWQWQSNMMVLDEGYFVDVQGFDLVCSGNGTFTMALTFTDTGNNFTRTFTVASNFPTTVRTPTSARSSTFTVTITANSSSETQPMVVYAFDLLYKSRYPVPVS